jgi:hypothetical protein
MGAFLSQAQYNESLLDLLDEKFPNDFFDWKVTIAFYAMVHYMNEYLLEGGRNITVSDHKDRNCQLNPNCADSQFPLSEENFERFYEIYLKSKAVRYNGIRNRDVAFQKWKEDYATVRIHYKELKKFIEEDLGL